MAAGEANNFLCFKRYQLTVELILFTFTSNGRRIPNYLFKNGKIVEIALATGNGHTSDGLSAARIVFLGEANHLRFFEHLEMTGKVAIGQRAELFELDKAEAFRMCHQRGQDT